MLLEVVVALAVLGTAGTTIIGTVGQALNAVQRARDAGSRASGTSAHLDVISLWPRADLERHLGVRREGRWRLEIQRSAATLYTVMLVDSADSLRTVLYRPDSSNVAP